MEMRELGEILKKHEKWLRGEEDGECADLRYADLRNADLRCVDLRYADLRNVDLRGARINRSTRVPWFGEVVMVQDELISRGFNEDRPVFDKEVAASLVRRLKKHITILYDNDDVCEKCRNHIFELIDEVFKNRKRRLNNE